MAERAIVVGGGVVGCAVTLELARRGMAPLLLEAGTIAAGVSGASLAALTRHLIGPVEDLPFVLDATAAWADLAMRFQEEVGIDIELDRRGQLRLIEAAVNEDGGAALAALEPLIEAERAAGLDVELLDPAGARRIVPLLETAGLAGASWCPSDAKLNPLLACRALASTAVARGAVLRPGTPVQRLVPGPGCWRGETARGTLETETVVVAAGPWTPRLLAPLQADVAAAIVPRRAQCCATGRLPALIRPVISSVSVGVAVGYTQLHQTRHGEVLFNTVVEGGDPRRPDGELAQHVDAAFLRASASTLVRLFPPLAHVRLLHSWAACEAWTADQRFLLGSLPGLPGLLIAAGDSGTGFLRAPLIGRLIAQLAAGERPDHDLARYAPARPRPTGAVA